MNKIIIIDARGLNYLKQTGVNVYTLHCLKIIMECADSTKSHKKNNPAKPTIILMGINPNIIPILKMRYPWLAGLLNNPLPLEQYLGVPKVLQRFVNNKVLGFLLEISLFLLPRVFFDRFWFSTIPATAVWQPSHKALPLHSTSQYYITIHDIFLILHSQNLAPNQIIRDSKVNLTRSALRATKVIVPSFSTARDTADTLKVAKRKIQVVYSGPVIENLLYNKIQSNKKQASPDIIPSKKRHSVHNYFVCISGIEPRKNWYNIIAAHYYNCLHRSDTYTASLYLIGIPIDNNYYQDLKKLITDNSIHGVFFVENASSDTKSNYLRNSICLIYASLYEGFGYPILEALAHGKAVITSQISSMPEVAQSAGLYVNPLDIVDIANSMMIMHTDEQFRSKLENNAKTVLSQFSWRENEQFWRTVFELN